MQAQHNTTLRRREHIDPDERTDGRDDAADAIERLQREGHNVARMSSGEIAERIDWSRSHVQAVLRHYFEPSAGKRRSEPTPKRKPHGGRLTVDVPENVENEIDYLQGYVAGRLSARER